MTNNVSYNFDFPSEEFSDEQSSIIYPASFDEIPSPIKKRAFSMLSLALVLAAVILGAHFLFPNFYYVEMLIAVLILGLFAAVRAFIVIKGTTNLGYIQLTGSVVNVYPEKFDKKSYTIQMYDENREVYLSFKYSGGKAIDPGIPVTLYLSPVEEIVEDGELGSLVESYLAVVFTTDTLSDGTTKKSAGSVFGRGTDNS